VVSWCFFFVFFPPSRRFATSNHICYIKETETQAQQGMEAAAKTFRSARSKTLRSARSKTLRRARRQTPTSAIELHRRACRDRGRVFRTLSKRARRREATRLAQRQGAARRSGKARPAVAPPRLSAKLLCPTSVGLSSKRSYAQ
jgi:hypothetical protein